MNQNNDDKGVDLSRVPDNSSSHMKFAGGEFQRPQSFQTSMQKIIQWIIEYSGGYVKDEKQASYVLIGLVVLAIIVLLFLFFGDGNSTPDYDYELINRAQPLEGYVP